MLDGQWLKKPLMGLGALFLLKISHDLYYNDWNKTQSDVNRDLFNLSLKMPFVGSKIQKQIDKDLTPMLDEIEQDVASMRDLESMFNQLNFDAAPEEALLAELDKLQMKPEDAFKHSGAIYCPQDNEALNQFLLEVYKRSQYSNPLHPEAWPKLTECAAQVIQMGLQMFAHPNPNEAFGFITPGGTYSILEACKAYRNKHLEEQTVAGRAVRYVFPQTPEMIVSSTAHAAFDKAAKAFGFKLIKIPVDPITQKADLVATERAITKNTLLLVGSAPSYPTGTMDDIEQLSELALKYHVGLHVDACLGGFVLPFLESTPYKFGFDVPGVTSISVDTHKQGGAEKGSSVILYRSRSELGQYQMSTHMDWSGGLYATPGLGGSASGFAMINAWAMMHLKGWNGYASDARAIHELVLTAKDFIDTEENLEVFGTPEANVIAIKSSSINIHVLADQLKAKGWHFNVLPEGIHFCFTGVHIHKENFFDEFRKDIKECAKYVSDHPELKAKSDGAIYGATKSLPKVFTPLKESMAKEYIGIQWRVPAQGLEEKLQPPSPV